MRGEEKEEKKEKEEKEREEEMVVFYRVTYGKLLKLV